MNGGIMNTHKIITAFAVFALFISLCGCTPDKTADTESCSKEIFAMDTYMTVTAYGENAEKAVNEALEEIKRLDDLLSAGNDKSEISILNKNGSASLSDDSRYLYEKADRIYRETGGAYDITILPLMKLWGFQDGDPSLPTDRDIKNTCQLIGADRLIYNDGRLTLGKGQSIDLGGIAKGYTGDRIMQIFEKNNISSGIISLGGNVQCFGKKPDGSLWRCGITDPDYPEDMSKLAGTVSTSDKAVITSGGYERFFTDKKSGRTFHHIMDPKTGFSADSGLISVTIVSSDGTLADGLSTACFVMGQQDSVSYWRSHRDEFDMILITDSRKILVTKGLEGVFSSGNDFEIID